MIAALFASALAADPLVDALAAELARNRAELALPDAPGPYWIGYGLVETHSYYVQASLGGLVRATESPRHWLSTGVRVGSPELDNTNFAESFFDSGDGYASLVPGGSPLAARHVAWLATDRAYKSAVENLARKQAARQGQAAHPRPPDFAPGSPAVSEGVPASPVDAATIASLQDLARRVSSTFLAHPDIVASRVIVDGTSGRMVLLDTGGTRVVKPAEELDLRVLATALAADGREVSDHATWVLRRPADLPPIEAIGIEVRGLVERLSAWRAAPVAEDAWSGPVVFLDDAAVDLFRSALVPLLRGTPPLEQGERPFGTPKSERPGAELGEAVLPPGWAVTDDPQRDPSLASSYAFDDQGVPAQAVRLVEDGRVVSLLTSRSPALGVPASNGHGRIAGFGLVRGEAAQMTVTPSRVRSRPQLLKQALKLAAASGLDHVLVVRRCVDPTLDRTGLDIFSLSFGRQPSGPTALQLRPPLLAYRHYADGREEPVRGYVFDALDSSLPTRIAGSGPAVTRTFLLAPYGSFGVTSGMPVTLTVPEVLIPGLRLVPDSSPALLPSPVVSPLLP